MTDVCLDGPVISAATRSGKERGSFKSTSKENFMAHASKEYPGFAAPDVNGLLPTKYRGRIQSDASKKREASSMQISSNSEPSVASKTKASNRTAVSASHSTKDSLDQPRCLPNNSVAASHCNASAPMTGELTNSPVLDPFVTGNPEHLEQLLLVAGLMDEQLQAFIADSFCVNSSKLRRLADKDPTLIPAIGRSS
jgi:hypothetical protein